MVSMVSVVSGRQSVVKRRVVGAERLICGRTGQDVSSQEQL